MAADQMLKRSTKEELEKIFRKYASVEKEGEWFMTHEDFVCRYLQLASPEDNADTVKFLADVADTNKTRLISFSEFRTFESLLCTPDVISQLAFKLFDSDNKGRISFDNFKCLISATTLHQNIPFDFNTSFVKQYFGLEHTHSLDYFEFSQLLQSLPTEHARQAFAQVDSNNSGTIPALDFVSLMKTIRGFRMSEYVQDHLLAVAGGSHTREVSYANFKAFNQFLGNLDIMERIVHSVAKSDPTARITHAQLLKEAQGYAQVTPLQVSYLFDLCSMEEKAAGSVSLADFQRLLPRLTPLSQRVAAHQPSTVSTKSSEDFGDGEAPWYSFLEPAYRFAMGSIAGATGATAVYPIDLVKTRMQNQRGSVVGEIMYKHSLDCFFKVIRNEGILGLYRGLLPQLVGVSPEKAIKLTANDTMRDFLRNKDGTLPLWKECIAGGTGGMCQVMFTNPIEIVKIRLQVAGEMAGTAKLGAWQVMKELGFMGLYKGASACFLRDIPFSAIYFPLYAHMKTYTSRPDGTNSAASLFTSGFIAGVPAAGLLTPADVIKTRLQVKARKGQQTYNGIVDCFTKILRTEGPRAFWKGAAARVFRSSPQFGVTLLTYELVQNLFKVNFKKKPPPSAAGIKLAPPTKPLDSSPFYLPDHIGGFRMAQTAFAGVESRYGIVFPKHSAPSTTSSN